jgi:hypothetical protein
MPPEVLTHASCIMYTGFMLRDRGQETDSGSLSLCRVLSFVMFCFFGGEGEECSVHWLYDDSIKTPGFAITGQV